MKTLIVTGSSGLLGQYLCRYFADSYRVVGLYNTNLPKLYNCETVAADLNHIDSMQRIFNTYNPDAIINTAGLTSVDRCQENPELAQKLNVEIPEYIAKCLSKTSTKLVHISTDHLFSGTDSLYSEEAVESPVNVYAKTKLAGDEAALKYPNSLVIRTNFYGGQTKAKQSFSSWLYSKLQNHETVHAVGDVFYTPISVCGLAENIEALVHSPLTGKFNIAGSDRVSKYDFAIKLAQAFNLATDKIIETKLENLLLKAPRPLDMSLSTDKIQLALPSYRTENVEQGLLKIRTQKLT